MIFLGIHFIGFFVKFVSNSISFISINNKYQFICVTEPHPEHSLAVSMSPLDLTLRALIRSRKRFLKFEREGYIV